MIGIIGAMDIEIGALNALMEAPESETVSGIVFTRGLLGGRSVVTAVCGVGKVFAAVCAQTMILRYGAEAVVNTGVAGSLTGELSIGDIAVADFTVQHDMDTTPIGDPPGLISGINLVKIPTDSVLTQRLASAVRRLGMGCLVGGIASGDQFLSRRTQKAAVAEAFGAVACEMEGAAVGQVCYVNGVPYAVIRSISDSFDGKGEMDYAEFRLLAAKNSSAVVVELLKSL